MCALTVEVRKPRRSAICGPLRPRTASSSVCRWRRESPWSTQADAANFVFFDFFTVFQAWHARKKPVYGQEAKSLCISMLDLSSRSRYPVYALADIIFIKAECRKQSSVVNANAGSD
jgi:hypothetical protein